MVVRLSWMVPFSPTRPPHATAGVKQAKLTFTGPTTTNGAPITAYQVTVFINGVQSYSGTLSSGPTTTLTVKGLVTGKHYSFKIAAVNVRGAGVQSASSNAVTPT